MQTADINAMLTEASVTEATSLPVYVCRMSVYNAIHNSDHPAKPAADFLLKKECVDNDG